MQKFTHENNIVKSFILLFLSLFMYAPNFAQNGKPEEKIDPAFRHLIEQSKLEASKKSITSLFKIEPTKGFAYKGAPVEERFECIIYTSNARALRDKGIVINSVLPNFSTAWVTLSQVTELASLSTVKFIEAPLQDKLHNDVSVGNTGASLLHQGKLNNTSYKGKNVIVAVYDGGIDWDHLDFRDPNDTTKSRILRIWDQTLTANTAAGEAPPAGFSYGVEYTQTQINDEIDGTPANIVRERDFTGHGSHVTGTAAGNGASLATRKYIGMAPEADIVFIKGGEGSFTSAREIDGMTYLKNLAASLGKPIVLNMSLGGQGGPHDGTLANEVAVDDFTSVPGRAVVISAGNDNGTNLHNRMVLQPGASSSVSFNVPAGTTGTDVFQFTTWAKGTPDITATVTAPGAGGTATCVAGESKGVLVMNDSFRINLTNMLYVTNGVRYVNTYITRNGTNSTSPAGTWTLTITNNSASPVTMDGWLNYTNTVFAATNVIGGDNEYMVGSPGNATSAITVASFAAKNNWYSYPTPGAFTFTTKRSDSISTFSSHGPRRDEVLKPDITGNGEVVISCLSSNTTTYATSSITNAGLYAKNQGTSMSAPGTAGAVALLLQANPGATATQIKNLLTSTATKDVMTELNGATPNPVWGHGKMDLFKAASSLFNCGPAERKTYKYDSSTRNGQETGSTFSTNRVAVRFTPDMTGKLAGTFFHTSTTATGLFIEVRSNNAGTPGGLLGSTNLDSAFVTRYAWQYIDLSNLNIAITSGTDYFIIIGRSATNTTNWSLRGEALAVDGRSFQSADAGVTWLPITTLDLKIRSVVYNNTQAVGTIAATNSSDTRNIGTSNQFINSNCALIAQLVPSGLNAVSGNVTSKVWIEGAVPTFNGSPYVARHYEVTPAANTATATGKVTLYFTQQEFNNFNAHPSSILDLPSNPLDVVGKANLKIGQYPGTSNDGTGLPGSYTSTPKVIDPADGDIVWNAESSRWEVSFDVTGFSGFIAQSNQFSLPIAVEYFRGNRQGAANMLTWKINCTGGTSVFEVERSVNGADFKNIGSLTATQAACLQPLSFKDDQPFAGNNYYRIKIKASGEARYTNTILLQTDRSLTNSLYPSLINKGGSVQVNFTGAKGALLIIDAAGRLVYSTILTSGVQTLSLPIFTSSIYFYSIKNENGSATKGKLIIE